jgi:hypothetical protein
MDDIRVRFGAILLMRARRAVPYDSNSKSRRDASATNCELLRA